MHFASASSIDGRVSNVVSVLQPGSNREAVIPGTIMLFANAFEVCCRWSVFSRDSHICELGVTFLVLVHVESICSGRVSGESYQRMCARTSALFIITCGFMSRSRVEWQSSSIRGRNNLHLSSAQNPHKQQEKATARLAKKRNTFPNPRTKTNPLRKVTLEVRFLIASESHGSK